MKLWRRIRSALKWLVPGIGVKRWLLLLVAGIAVLSLALVSLFRGLYPLPDLFYYLTLQFIPRFWRGLLLGLAGVAAVVFALIRLNRALLEPFVKSGGRGVADVVYRFRQQGRGPRVVAIGGGQGLSVLLRGLKQHTSNVTAIVTMADDGGSSGRLRRELGVLPPGDVRNCIAALADDEALTTRLFQYRFGNGSGLDGHTLGNLFITAMAEVTGSFERATLESGRVLAIRGQVLPSTLQDVTLMADLRGEANGVSRVRGESSIPDAAGEIERVYLTPDDAPAYPGAVRALLDADLIVAGPGSLYTSILPNLLVPDVTEAITASRALKVFVVNVATQRGETDGYTAGDHVAALDKHTRSGLFPIVLANETLEVEFDAPQGVELVTDEFPTDLAYRVVRADLVDSASPWRHDGNKLARALLRLL
ncbi:MAG: uridine diphosphate-N-acetylglucosamine-binding protein YvcK [Anaerolineales bacterium]|nr:MAG: uridine diphosphate-N-acetylglucosamine-binding protein YvcK [Anaerolineales bacterium]